MEILNENTPERNQFFLICFIALLGFFLFPLFISITSAGEPCPIINGSTIGQIAVWNGTYYYPSINALLIEEADSIFLGIEGGIGLLLNGGNITANNFFGNWNGSSNYLLNTGDTATGDYSFTLGNINIGEGYSYLYDEVQGLMLSKGASDSVYTSTFVGEGAGNTAAYRQTALGYYAGHSNEGDYQTALGVLAGYLNTGDYQTALSYNAGRLNTGNYQTALGRTAGYSNTGDYQTALGVLAGYLNTGDYQTALGVLAGHSNTGVSQIALGRAAGYSNTGDYQTSLGVLAGHSNTGNKVTGVGYEATRNNTANDVVAIGYQAGKDNTVSNQFIIKQTNINAVPLIQGDFATGYVGIGTTSPQNTLNVIGDGNFTGLLYGNGSQLTDLPAGSESDPQWTANSTLVGYLASNNKWTENQNMTNQNITDVQCINFQNGASWCGV